MKTQIKNFSPHQNAKVFAVLTAISSLIFIVPMVVIVLLMAPPVDQHGNPTTIPTLMMFLMPIAYLIFGYISVAIGCLIYNFITKFIGGIEFEIELDGE